MIDDDRVSLVSASEMDDSNSPEVNLPPLDKRVLAAVRRIPDLRIKPARLASELGLSIEDATAELCGLLRAVGSSATFVFESVSAGTNTGIEGTKKMETMTMVFQFPPDFEQKANSTRRKEDTKEVMKNIFILAVKIIKVVVAFGLIISIAILLVGGLCAMVAAIIAMSRGGHGGRHNQQLSNHTRSMLLSLRQLLWFFAIFGEGFDNGQDPFIRETAHTMALGLNVVMGSPRSIWFWMNARRFRDRQQRGRGWGLNNTRFQSTDRDRGSWGQQLREARTSSSSLYDVDQRGILSVAVEFLFGPTPFDPGPTDFEKWKIREHCIVAVSTRSQGKGVSIAQLLPYSDYPPDIKSVQNQIILGDGKLECLNIISHFNGVPIGSRGVAFIFPELMAESSSVEIQVTMPSNKGPWQAFFFSDDLLQEFSESGQRHDGGQTNGLLEYLQEKYYVLTELSKKQFSQCCILNILNYIGIQMLRTAILKGGTLQIQNRSALSASNGLLSILDFYARLFFAIPLLRGMIIAMLNLRVNQRNDKRKEFAENLTLNL
jgi:hypothetical protein